MAEASPDTSPGDHSDSDEEEALTDPRSWPLALRQLLLGDLCGEPRSLTGLLAGVAPMLRHAPPQEHPERPARLVAVYAELLASGLAQRAKHVPCRAASRADLRLVHSAAHVRRATRVYASAAAAGRALSLGEDTYFSAAHSGAAASLAAGSVVELTTRVCTGELRNAIAAVRPPGHHCDAPSRQAMGFCLLNNVPIAVAVARRRLGVERVLVVDWDVHHGNGVQNMFYDDPSVLYVSLHRYGGGFYPGTGAPSEVGVGPGVGANVNVAWSGRGYGDAEYLSAFERLVMPLARAFSPQLVLVSAGFDAAAGDPLGEMALSPVGYAHMTALLSTLAGGKIVVALEGGYNLRSIARAAAGVMRVLLGEPAPPLPQREVMPRALDDIERVRRELAPHWPCLRLPKPSPLPTPKRIKRSAIQRKLRGRWWLRYL
ncbi:hypothetical protein AB1Y20_010938 [Prymnesium parvum]|uniref:Histone deacetylase domain-containing protein n=1 Tax=Prymnesium parvum TaxID=97485 RepID=A0AB34ISW9_PRYPA